MVTDEALQEEFSLDNSTSKAVQIGALPILSMGKVRMREVK